MKSRHISFDVGTNFDYELFDIIRENDKEHLIHNLYGKIKSDGLPGGRATSIIPDFSMNQLCDYVKECKKNKLTFNYLINPLCLGQKELDPDEGTKIRSFIHDAYDIGIRAFTVNSPSLIKYIKKQFSDVFITLGLYAYPVNVQHIEYWRSWGVDEITLDHTFNRNFELLKKVMTLYKDSDLRLRVIANNLCIKDCPFRLAHGCFASHSVTEGISMDYMLINCLYRKITTPKSILTSEWIRPEDIHLYEELASETGYTGFSVKLVDRTRPTSFIERVIKAYMSESYDGNLLDILNWPDSGNIVNIPRPNADSNHSTMRYMDRLKPECMVTYGRAMHLPHIYIDNNKLNGFIDHFIKCNNCADSLCADNILPEGEKSPISCNYCGLWAGKAITYNHEEIEQWKNIASGVLNNLENGKIYKE